MKTTYSFYEFNLMTVFISFLGFWVENCWLAFSHGYIDNRNMNLPFLLGYGLAVTGFYLVIGTPENIKFLEALNIHIGKAAGFIVYFLLSAVLISVGEILLGMFVEAVFGFEYWNYTDLPLHITKYTSVPTSAAFGAGMTLFVGCFYEPVMSYIHSMPASVVKIAGIAFMVILIIDFFVSFASMYHNHSLYIKWVRNISRMTANRRI